jgi:beta-glucanase (GH16 family)
MIRTALAVSALAACLIAMPAAAHAPTNRTLLWADEFNEAELDRDNWNVIGTDFWVNNEQQAYVDAPEVLSIVDDAEGAHGGALMLRPIYAPGIDPNPEREADFLSGRVESQGKYEFNHGRAEARIKMPDAEGVWPAWWLLGNGRWPDTGEVDIMEYVGEKDWIGVALHGPGYSGETPLVNKYFFPEGEDVTDWHVYAVEWKKDELLFQVDGRTVYRVTRPMVEHYGKWSYDNPKYLILNFALGGAYPFKTNGIEEPYNGLPQATVDKIKAGDVAMLVDWVRVYAPQD